MTLIIKRTDAEPILTTERTFDLQLLTKLGEKPRIVARREQVDMQGDQVKQWITDKIVVTRELEAVEAENIDVAGTAVTVSQLMDALASLMDRWAIEDRPQLAENVQTASAQVAQLEALK